MLGRYRVLDFTESNAHLCARILGDMGADVVKVEPPRGDSSRAKGPFVGDLPGPNHSVWWLAYNAGKRGITLDIEIVAGRALFRTLVRETDFLIESFRPGYLESLGLGYQALREVKPDLIMTSITPFGQTGPYRQYEASDLVLMAMGGFMSENGYPDSPPIKMSLDQAFHHGAAYGAAASLTALHARSLGGGGQHVDVSVQECLALMFDSPVQDWLLEGKAGTNRVGCKMPRGAVVLRLVWPCKDGFVTWRLFTGAAQGRRTHVIIDWAEEDGMDTGLKGTRWDQIDMMTLSQERLDRWEKVFGDFFLSHTKDELVEGALKRRMMIYPVNDMASLLGHRHLAAREFFVDVDHPGLATPLMYPGPYWKCPEAPLRMSRGAPSVGEHNQEVYVGEMGLSRGDLTALRATGAI